jgi:predicted SnoaL-like aldol condensation-catalyzing enzyme
MNSSDKTSGRRLRRLAIGAAILAIGAVPFWPGLAQAAHGSVQTPKQVVDAIDQAIMDHHPQEAIHKYFGADFIEHDPEVAGGNREGLVAYMTAHGWDPNGNHQIRDIIDRIIAQGPWVVVEHHLYEHPGDPGQIFVDTYRVEGGLVREHWDIMQPIRSSTANKYTMY